ncbi:MAG: glycosyltransferase [Gammaproteobacteria bacterium]|nr:glycosyltransferase [Gammaproteobacteria bacterium]
MMPREPLVSVIVRSMDRDSLKEALDSISAQSWPAIEILVVNAKGPHRDLPSSWGPHPLKVLSKGHPLPRSQAANVGLKAAQGTYIAFLDDDDVFFEDHVLSLVHHLEKAPHIRAVYAGVRVEMYERGSISPLRTFDFNEPFNLRKLQGRNYIPIHAMLFERSLVIDQGCHFDESLDLFEDWDFWLQLSQHTAFMHHDKITALYRNHGESGLGEDDLEEKKVRILEATADVLAKWGPKWAPMEWAAILLERDALSEQVLERQQDRLSQLETERIQLTLDLQQQKETVATLLSSTSWRMTQPLRYFVRQLKSITSSSRDLGRKGCHRNMKR